MIHFLSLILTDISLNSLQLGTEGDVLLVRTTEFFTSTDNSSPKDMTVILHNLRERNLTHLGEHWQFSFYVKHGTVVHFSHLWSKFTLQKQTFKPNNGKKNVFSSRKEHVLFFTVGSLHEKKFNSDLQMTHIIFFSSSNVIFLSWKNLVLPKS